MNVRRLLRWVIPSRAFFRVTAYVVFMFSVAAALAARVLYADAKEAAMSMGHELAQVSDFLTGAETILVNGEQLHHASTYVDQDVSVVLDRFESACRSSPGAVGRAMNGLPNNVAKKNEKATLSLAARLGIIRQEDKGRGMIACFVDERPTSIFDFKDRLRRFVATKRLGEFGRLRYLYAEQKPGGQTHVVTTWADTELDLRAMFPAEGDAAGADSRVVPRPPNAKRTMSAAADGVPYGLWMYASTDRAEAIKAFYADFAKRGGLRVVQSPEDASGSLAYVGADGHQVYISLGEKDGQTFVTLTEAGWIDRPSIVGVEVTSE